VSGELDAVVKPGLRAAAVLAAWVVVISAAPSLADVLDRHGLPGTAIALVMVFGLAAASVVMVARSLPRTSRMRLLSSAARSAGFGWRSRLRAPSSMFRLPTFRRGSMTVQLFNLVVVESRSDARLVFDVAELPDPGYGDTKWRTSAATHVPYDFPALVVEPRRLVSVDVADGMTVVSTDLGSVDDRWGCGPTTAPSRWRSSISACSRGSTRSTMTGVWRPAAPGWWSPRRG
jgi:hypothetical protein